MPTFIRCLAQQGVRSRFHLLSPGTIMDYHGNSSKNYFYSSTLRVRVPSPTYRPHPPCWRIHTPQVTSNDYLSTLSCVLVCFNWTFLGTVGSLQLTGIGNSQVCSLVPGPTQLSVTCSTWEKSGNETTKFVFTFLIGSRYQIIAKLAKNLPRNIPILMMSMTTVLLPIQFT